MISYIYFLFKSNNLVYIGVTNNIKRRLLEHGKCKYDKYRVIECAQNKAAAYEKRLIKFFKPVLNLSAKNEPKVTVSTRMETEVIDLLKSEAAKLNITFSKYLESLVEDFAKRNKLV